MVMNNSRPCEKMRPLPRNLDERVFKNEKFLGMIDNLCYNFVEKSHGEIDLDEWRSLANYWIGVYLRQYDPKQVRGRKDRLAPYLYHKVRFEFMDHLRDESLTTKKEREKGIERYYVPEEHAKHLPAPPEYVEEFKDCKDRVAVLLRILTPVERVIVSTVSVHGYNFSKAARQCNLKRHHFRRLYSLALEKMRRRAEELSVDHGQRADDRARLLRTADRLGL